MKLHLLFVGKTSFPELEQAIERYLSRIRHYIPAEVHVVKPEKITAKAVPQKVMDKEGERILKTCDLRDTLVAWDAGGRSMSSEKFAEFWDRLFKQGRSGVWMIVGGPLGLSPRVLSRAQWTLSLSSMTFPHDLARLMLVEQTYRALTILRGEPYHK